MEGKIRPKYVSESDEYRFLSPAQEKNDRAQILLLRVIYNLRDRFTPDQVLTVVGDAKAPYQVFRATSIFYRERK